MYHMIPNLKSLELIHLKIDFIHLLILSLSSPTLTLIPGLFSISIYSPKLVERLQNLKEISKILKTKKIILLFTEEILIQEIYSKTK